MRALAAIIAAAVTLATALPAAALKPREGEYNWGDYHTICVRADGTWYGITFGPWAGEWTHRAP